jgi:multidrug efflux pump subunit AcrA (membrane-fusion protein)
MSVSAAGKVIRSAAPLAVVVAGAGIAVALSWSREAPKPREVTTVTPLVETVPVSLAEGGLDLTADGVVVPYRNIKIASEVEGRVIEKSENCREGKAVKAGEVLLKVDPANYNLEIARFQSQRDQTQANLAELAVQIGNVEASIALAKEDVELQRNELRRVGGLEKRGVATEQARDTALRAELTARTNLVKLESEKRSLEAQKTRWEEGVKLVEAQLDQAKLDLSRTVIRAPADGVVCTTNVEKDGYLKRGDPIGTFEDTAAVEVRTNLEMRAIAWLRAHLPADAQEKLGPYDLPPVPVTVTYEVLGNTYAWRGVLSRVDGFGVDERTRTVPCRVHVADPRGVSLKSGSADLPIAAPPALVRGMYVKVTLHTTTADPLLSVPEVAVRPDGGVWAVRDGKLAHFDLPAARLTHGAVLVAPQVTRLKAGDRVVISPLPAASEGTAVRVKDEEKAGAEPDSMTAGARPAKVGEARR